MFSDHLVFPTKDPCLGGFKWKPLCWATTCRTQPAIARFCTHRTIHPDCTTVLRWPSKKTKCFVSMLRSENTHVPCPILCFSNFRVYHVPHSSGLVQILNHKNATYQCIHQFPLFWDWPSLWTYVKDHLHQRLVGLYQGGVVVNDSFYCKHVGMAILFQTWNHLYSTPGKN